MEYRFGKIGCWKQASSTPLIKMKNRTRGEYKDSCFIFGFVLDSEFEVARDPVG